MCLDPVTLTAIAAGAQLVGGMFAADQQRRAGEQQKAYYEMLAKNSEKQAGYSQDEGGHNVKNLRSSVDQLRGSQKAIMAAKGIDSTSVTSQDIAIDTFEKQKMDELTIRHNADLKSEAYYDQANQYRTAGENAKTAADAGAFNTLLGSASGIADTWMKWKKVG